MARLATLADMVLTLMHVGVVLCILLAWIPRSTRAFHLLLVGVTAVSWFGLGLFYGVGYCFLSDWHWQLKRWRGQTDLPGSFIHYALTRWLGLSLSETSTDILTGVAFALASCLSLALNLRDWRRRRRERVARV